MLPRHAIHAQPDYPQDDVPRHDVPQLWPEHRAHTGAGGIAWIVKGSKNPITVHGSWECLCRRSRGVYHAHAPLEVVTEQEVAEALASITKGTTT